MPEGPVEPVDASGRRFAIVLVDEAAGEDDQGLVIHGRARWDGATLRFEGHHREDLGFMVPAEALEDLRWVEDDVRDLLADAEVWTMLPLAALPEGVNPGDFSGEPGPP